jgi:hypothetical protein
MVAANRLTSFSETINVPFIPTHIKVSNIYYDATPADVASHVLSSNLITSLDNRIAVIHDGLAMAEPVVFTNTNPINGQYQFTIDNGGLDAGVFSMTISFMR